MTNKILLSLCGWAMLGLIPNVSLAQTTPTTQPTLPPVPQVALQHGMTRVEVFAFTPVNNAGQGDWIGHGIQESLQTDVSRTGATLLLPAPVPAGSDPIALATHNHADLAVIGSYQTVGDDIRVTGHLVAVPSNTTLGSFAATGPQKNLFTIEDALGEQLRRLLPASPVAAQTSPAILPEAPPAAAPTIVYQQAPQVDYPPPAVNNYYDSVPSYDYGYPGYVSTYPFGFYGGIGIYSGGYFGNVGHRDFNRGGYTGRSNYTGGYNGGRSFGTTGGVGTQRGFGTSSGFGGARGGFGGARGGFGGGHSAGGHR